jgi:hypothetical protein
LEDGLLSDLGLLLSKLVGTGFAIAKGSVILIGSLTHLLKQGLVSYSMASVRESKRFAGLFHNNVKTIPFVPLPMAGTSNPTLIRRMMDAALWLQSLDQFCLNSYHDSLRKLISESASLSNRASFHDSEYSIPATLDSYDTKNVLCPGWQGLPAALEPLTSEKEKKLVTCLIKDVNDVFFTGLDGNPDFSRKASRPMKKEKKNTVPDQISGTLTIGGSNANKTAEALSNLGIDSYKLASSGWKLTKEKVATLIPDLKEVIEQIPDSAPIILFCLDNTCFKVATADGELTNISKCVAEDDGYHINGDLVVAPEFFIKGQAALLKQLIANCGSHIIYILCPVPRFITFRCCDDPAHCTNFANPDYLSTILTDLKKVRETVAKEIPAARVVDTLELMMGSDKKDDRSKEEAVRVHWSTDPVHANLHSYYKLASNLLDLHKNFKPSSQAAEAGPKRGRSVSTSNVDSSDESNNSMNPPKKRREENRGKHSGNSGSYREPRHWQPAGTAGSASVPSYHERGQQYQPNRYEDRYSHSHNYGHRGGYSGYGYEDHRGGRGHRSRGRGRGRPGGPPYY